MKVRTTKRYIVPFSYWCLFDLSMQLQFTRLESWWHWIVGILSSCRWKSTPRWTWRSLTLWTMSWDVDANTMATELTCMDVMQVRTEKPFPLPHFIWTFPLLHDWLVCSFPHNRWCIQCRDWGPVWAPEANHQQQRCVEPPRGPVPFNGAQRRNRVGWGRWPQALGGIRPSTYQQHTTWRRIISSADVDTVFISASYHSSDHCRDSIDNKTGTVARWLNWFFTLVKQEDFGYWFILYRCLWMWTTNLS